MNWADYFRRKGVLPRYGNFVGPEWSGGKSFPSVYDMIHVEPVDVLDAIAKDHDLRYFVALTTQDVQNADALFVKHVDEALQRQWISRSKEKVLAQIAKAAMLVKMKAEQAAGPLYGQGQGVPASQRDRVLKYLQKMDAQGGIVNVFYRRTYQS